MTRNLMTWGASWLSEKLKDHASETIVFERGSLSVSWDASIRSTTIQVENEPGYFVDFEASVFEGKASELILNGQVATPQLGDKLRVPSGLETLIYEVFCPSSQLQPYTLDPYRNRISITTKLVRAG